MPKRPPEVSVLNVFQLPALRRSDGTLNSQIAEWILVAGAVHWNCEYATRCSNPIFSWIFCMVRGAKFPRRRTGALTEIRGEFDPIALDA